MNVNKQLNVARYARNVVKMRLFSWFSTTLRRLLLFQVICKILPKLSTVVKALHKLTIILGIQLLRLQHTLVTIYLMLSRYTYYYNKVNVVQSWMGEEDAIMVTILNLPTNKVTQRAVKCEINKVVLILLLSKCHCQQSWEIKGLCISAKRDFWHSSTFYKYCCTNLKIAKIIRQNGMVCQNKKSMSN